MRFPVDFLKKMNVVCVLMFFLVVFSVSASNEKLMDFSKKLNIYCDALNDEINFLVKYPNEKESDEIQKLLFDVYVVEIQRIFEEYRKEYERFSQLLNKGKMTSPAPGFEIIESYDQICSRVESTLKRFEALKKGNVYGMVKDFRDPGTDVKTPQNSEKIREQGVVSIGDRTVPLLKSNLEVEKKSVSEPVAPVKINVADYTDLPVNNGEISDIPSNVKQIPSSGDEFSFPEKFVNQRYAGKIQRLKEQNSIQKKVDKIKTQIRRINEKTDFDENVPLLQEIEKNEFREIKSLPVMEKQGSMRVIEKNDEFTLKTTNNEDRVFSFHSNNTEKKEEKNETENIALDFGWKTQIVEEEKVPVQITQVPEKKTLDIKISPKPVIPLEKNQAVVEKNQPSIMGSQISPEKKEIPLIKEVSDKKLIKEFTVQSGSDKKSPRMLAVMVENHRKARPQSGLDKAKILFEILAEGGITRFMGIYDSASSAKVGPVRSSRDYFLKRNAEFDSVYIHCGASPQAFDLIDSKKIDAINEIKHTSGFFRIKDRNAPHNLYADLQKFPDLIEKYGFARESNFDALKRNYLRASKELKLPEPQNSKVDITYHKRYQVGFNYDPISNTYLRTMNKEPHNDKITGKQLAFSNVIIERVEVNFIKGDDKGRISMEFNKGKGYLLRGGETIPLEYYKKDFSSPMEYTDKNGKAVLFNPGNIMIMVVNKSARVKFE